MRTPLRVLVACLVGSCAVPVGLAAQSVLERSPNVSGNWVVRPGTVQFNFLHRFVRSPGPVRKVSNYPTFLLATSLVPRTMLGFNYATNSTLAPKYPNEWEFFARVLAISQETGAPLDLGGQVGYNLAANGIDGEISLGRRFGPIRLTGVGRALSDPYTNGGGAQFAFGAGGAFRLTRHLALAGDYVTLRGKDKTQGERGAWSAAIQLAIPNTPHSFSIQATNTNTATLQGASRGGQQTRYGFEFTIPFTLARYFGHHPKPAAAQATTVPAGEVLKTGMRNLAYLNATIEIPAGGTIEWKNEDQLPHTVTADDSTFDSGLIEGGATWRMTFSQPGTYPFHCTPHPFMKGTIVVR